MTSVATKLFRQIRSKAKEIDTLTPVISERFQGTPTASQSRFGLHLTRWSKKSGVEIASAAAAPAASSEPPPPLTESLRGMIGDEGHEGDLNLTLGFEMIREMSQHLLSIKIALEWSELVHQADSPDSIADSNSTVSVERGAFLIDRVSKYLRQELEGAEDDRGIQDLDFGLEYQNSSMHPIDRKAASELDGIAEMARKRIREKKEGEGAHEPSAPEILQLVNQVLYSDLGLHGIPKQEYYNQPKFATLSHVLESRCGAPYPMCVVHAAVSSRLGLSIRGVRLPTHLLLRVNFAAEDGLPPPPPPPPAADQTESEQVLEEQGDIKVGSAIEVYWNGDDKWYPAEIKEIKGGELTVDYWDLDQRHTTLDMAHLNQLPDLHVDTLVFRMLGNKGDERSKLTIGKRVEVFWTADMTWYPATVKWIDDETVLVQYDDGDGRNTAIPLEVFGQPPEKEKKMVFRLFKRPYNNEADSMACFVDAYNSGSILSHAECSKMLRHIGVHPTQFHQHLAPVGHSVVWQGMIKHLLGCYQSLRLEKEAGVWADQLHDLSNLMKLHNGPEAVSGAHLAGGAGEVPVVGAAEEA